MLFVGIASAQSPADAVRRLESAARAADPAFSGFSAERGAKFFHARHGRDWSCSSCHTADPRADGRHIVTGKALAPLAPTANAARFRNPARTDKWFRRNCNDVLGRECTAVEKGDVLAYLLLLHS
jgi:mono/diheme cytochrome c family protein